jgi:hypothetical protein
MLINGKQSAGLDTNRVSKPAYQAPTQALHSWPLSLSSVWGLLKHILTFSIFARSPSKDLLDDHKHLTDNSNS